MEDSKSNGDGSNTVLNLSTETFQSGVTVPLNGNDEAVKSDKTAKETNESTNAENISYSPVAGEPLQTEGDPNTSTSELDWSKYFSIIACIMALVALIFSLIVFMNVNSMRHQQETSKVIERIQSIESINELESASSGSTANAREKLKELAKNYESANNDEAQLEYWESIWNSSKSYERWIKAKHQLEETGNTVKLTIEPGVYINNDTQRMETWFSNKLFSYNGSSDSAPYTIDDNGLVRDASGYLLVSAPDEVAEIGDIIETSLGEAKVFDVAPYVCAKSPNAPKEEPAYPYIYIYTAW